LHQEAKNGGEKQTHFDEQSLWVGFNGKRNATTRMQMSEKEKKNSGNCRPVREVNAEKNAIPSKRQLREPK